MKFNSASPKGAAVGDGAASCVVQQSDSDICDSLPLLSIPNWLRGTANSEH
jgi:hypothetical protein